MINVVGNILCAREAVKRMSTAHGGKGGVIVNLSSRTSELGGAGSSVHYGASKAAINTFTIGLAQEVAAEGVRVCASAKVLLTPKCNQKDGLRQSHRRTHETSWQAR